MPARRTGQNFPCMICGTMFYRQPSHIRRGIKKTCGKSECKSASMRGENNPTWGTKHSPEILEKMRLGRLRNPGRKRGPRGYKHTPEARIKMSEALRERWKTNRDKMLAQLPRGDDHPLRKLQTERRYRIQFTPLQRQEWKDSQCFWCRSTDDLVLDHIIPVMAGGKSERTNCQTLCRLCNLWKMRNIDVPFYLATLGSQGGQT